MSKNCYFFTLLKRIIFSFVFIMAFCFLSFFLSLNRVEAKKKNYVGYYYMKETCIYFMEGAVMRGMCHSSPSYTYAENLSSAVLRSAAQSYMSADNDSDREKYGTITIYNDITSNSDITYDGNVTAYMYGGTISIDVKFNGTITINGNYLTFKGTKLTFNGSGYTVKFTGGGRFTTTISTGDDAMGKNIIVDNAILDKELIISSNSTLTAKSGEISDLKVRAGTVTLGGTGSSITLSTITTELISLEARDDNYNKLDSEAQNRCYYIREETTWIGGKPVKFKWYGCYLPFSSNTIDIQKGAKVKNNISNCGVISIHGGEVKKVENVSVGSCATKLPSNRNIGSSDLTMYGGSITSITNSGTTSISGGTVTTKIENYGTVNVNGGEVKYIDNGGTVNMSGGKITTNGNYGIRNNDNATVNVTGGEINNTGSTSEDFNNAIYNANGKVTIEGGTLKCTRTDKCLYSFGGTVKITNSSANISSVNMLGRKDETTKEWLGSIEVSGGNIGTLVKGNYIEMTISGGKIDEVKNYSGKVNIKGGKIGTINNTGVLNISGGTIGTTDGKNYVNSKAINNTDGGTVTVSGGTIKCTGTEKCLYNWWGYVVIESGSISNVYAMGTDEKGSVIIKGGTITGIVEKGNYIKMDISGGTIAKVINYSGETNITGGTVTTLTNSSGKSTISSTSLYSYGSVGTVTVNGGTLYVKENGKVTGNITNGGMTYVKDNATVTRTITNNANKYLYVQGGSVGSISNSGTTSITGGTVTKLTNSLGKSTISSTSSSYGSVGTVTVNDGTLYVQSNGRVTVKITNGGTTSISGGSVSSITNSGTLTISGGKVGTTDGTNYNASTAITNSSGTVVVSGGTIKGTSKGIYNSSTTTSSLTCSSPKITATILMCGGTIGNNGSGASRRGIDTVAGTVTITSGTIGTESTTGIYNSATLNVEGGTVYATEKALELSNGVNAITGGIIGYNDYSYSEIGVYIGMYAKIDSFAGTNLNVYGSEYAIDNYSTYEVKIGKANIGNIYTKYAIRNTISANSLTLEYTNVYGKTIGISNISKLIVDNGTRISSSEKGINNYSSASVTINDGTISGLSYGIYNEGTIEVKGGEISSGSGIDTAGIYNGGKLTISGGTISSLVNKNGTSTVSGGVLETANVLGGDLYLNGEGNVTSITNSGTTSISGGTVTTLTNSSGTTTVSGSTTKVGTITNSGTLTISGGTVGNSSTETAITNSTGGTIVVSGGTITGTSKGIDNSSTMTKSLTCSSTNNKVTILVCGGTIENIGTSGYKYGIYSNVSATIRISGGTIGTQNVTSFSLVTCGGSITITGSANLVSTVTIASGTISPTLSISSTSSTSYPTVGGIGILSGTATITGQYPQITGPVTVSVGTLNVNGGNVVGKITNSSTLNVGDGTINEIENKSTATITGGNITFLLNTSGITTVEGGCSRVSAYITDVTVNGGNFNFSGLCSYVTSALYNNENATSTVSAGYVKSIINTSNLNIESSAYIGWANSSGDGTVAITNNEGGTIVVSGGTISATEKAIENNSTTTSSLTCSSTTETATILVCGGTIGNSGSAADRYAINNESGIVSGTIVVVKGTIEEGSLVGIGNAGTLNVLGGSVTSVVNSGTTTISGGTVTTLTNNSNTSTISGGSVGTAEVNDGTLYVKENGEVTGNITNSGTTLVSGGTVTTLTNNSNTSTISGGSVETVTVNGGTLYVKENGEVTCNITNGGTTYVNDNATVTGTITNNANKNLYVQGGSVGSISNSGTTTISGGTIGNSSTATAITNSTGGTIVVSGGTIKGKEKGISNENLATASLTCSSATETATILVCGGTIGNNGRDADRYGIYTTKGTVTVLDGSSIGEGSTKGIYNEATLNINGGSIGSTYYDADFEDEGQQLSGLIGTNELPSTETAIENSEKGTIDVFGGFIYGKEYGIKSEVGRVNVYGGKIAAYNPGGEAYGLYVSNNSEMEIGIMEIVTSESQPPLFFGIGTGGKDYGHGLYISGGSVTIYKIIIIDDCGKNWFSDTETTEIKGGELITTRYNNYDEIIEP